ncbi:hypothetical protein ACOSP7_022693 [Xanthoceras sorbifolium]
MSFRRSKDSRINDNDSGKWLSLGNKKAYKCLICAKTFDTGPALGGHQNAHRKEREEAASRILLASVISKFLGGQPHPPKGDSDKEDIDLTLKL